MKDTLLDAASVKAETDRFLAGIFEERIDQADRVSVRYGDLWRSARRLVDQGGKRLRPYLVHAAYRAFGGDDPDTALQAGGAVELLHVALLIHDDIIDRDTRRYGIKNVTGQYMEAYAPRLGSPDEVRHYANSAALMAGDLLISEAYRLMNGIPDVPPARRQKAIDFFAESVFLVCGGELLDTESAFAAEPLSALQIAECKTASYSFAGPLLIGATLAGAAADQLEKLQEIASNLGIAYQLRDDVLGIFGDTAVTGKTTVGDIREGKRTFMVEEFYARAAARDRQAFDRVFGVQGLSAGQYHQAAGLIESCGARAACEERIQQLGQRAHELIDKLAIDGAYKQVFDDIVRRTATRVK